MAAYPKAFGRYLLEERIAMGGMAEIFRARTRTEGFERPVCIKRILPHFLNESAFVTMFRDEAALAARLQHANIVQVFDFGEEDETLYLAMELIDGADLKRLLDIAHRRGEPFGVGSVLQLGMQMCRGLHYAHALKDDAGQPLGLVHRDVSPHNVLVSRAGEVKVTDFGIAKAAQRATHTSTGIVKGKLAYMAPEQAEGLLLDHRADQFATGVVLWEALAGERLFTGNSEAEVLRKVLVGEVRPPSEIDSRIPRIVDDVVLRALERDREKRFPDMRGLEQALGRAYFELSSDPSFGDLHDRVSELLDTPRAAPRRTEVAPAVVEPDLSTEPIEQRAVSALDVAERGDDDDHDSTVGRVFTDSGPRPPAAGGESLPTELVAETAVGVPPVSVEPASEVEATRSVFTDAAPSPFASRDAASDDDDDTLALDDGLNLPRAPAPAAARSPSMPTPSTIPSAPASAAAARAPRDADAPTPSSRRGSFAVVGISASALAAGAFLMAGPRTDEGPRANAATPVEAIAPGTGTVDDGTPGDTPAALTTTPPPPGDDAAGTATLEAAGPPEDASSGAADAAAPARGDEIPALPDAAVAPTALEAPAASPRARAGRSPKRELGTVYVDVVGTWAHVYEGKRKLGETPVLLSLPEGRHRLRLANPHTGLSKTVPVTVRAGRREDLRVTP